MYKLFNYSAPLLIGIVLINSLMVMAQAPAPKTENPPRREMLVTKPVVQTPVKSNPVVAKPAVEIKAKPSEQLIGTRPKINPFEKATQTQSLPIETAELPPGAQALMSVDFADTDIREVLRSISTAYGLSIITERDVEGKVSIHLENVTVIDGLRAVCNANGFEVVQEGNILRIRKQSETTRNILKMNFQRIDLDVKNRDIREFIAEFSQKTGLNILAGSDLTGTVTGSWQNQIPIDGFRALMDAHNYKIKSKNGFYIVYSDESSDKSIRRRTSGTGNSSVEVKEGRVSLDLDKADLQEVLRDIAGQANLNIVFYGQASEIVNATIKDASIEEAFSTLMKGSKYTWVMSGEGTLLVGETGPKSVLTSNEIYLLTHMQAEKVRKLIPKALLENGVQITEIVEQNALLITGAITQIQPVREFLDLVDVATPQVLLECIIVEFKQGAGSEYGISSGRGLRTSDGSPALRGFAGFNGKKYVPNDNPLRPEIGFRGADFEFELSAMEQDNKAKILARPSISTINGNKASIQVTNTMYYQINQVSKDGQPINDFRPINDGITLEITPSVTQGGEVTIDIRPEIKTSSLSSAGTGPRDVSTRTLSTTVKLRDGQTVRLGGLIQSSKDFAREYVPILGSIPLLGWLFSYRKEVETTTELVLFITPRIIAAQESVDLNIGEELKQMEKRSDFEGAAKSIVKPSRQMPPPGVDVGSVTKTEGETK
jgi:type IV pilus assembly protein PilQ